MESFRCFNQVENINWQPSFLPIVRILGITEGLSTLAGSDGEEYYNRSVSSRQRWWGA